MDVLPTLTDGTPFYTFTTILDGIPFGFRFAWNDREESWYFDISDNNQNLIVGSLKVTLSTPLLSRFILPAMPPGDLIAIDTSGTDTMPGITDLGDRVLLIYVEQSELALVTS